MSSNSTNLRQRVLDLIDAGRDALIADTVRILQFQTVSGGNTQESADSERDIPACFEWLGQRAAAMGFDFRVIEGRVGEIAWRHADPNAPIVGIASHIDVVTASQGQWTHPPFSGTIADGQIWGRGIQDDKGPLLQVLHGMHACKQAGVQPPCHVHVIVGTQEETGDWSDITRYLEVAETPDMGFTPDADFPIINGEKGMLNLVVEADWPETGIDPETELEFFSLIGGERENIVPSSCELTVRFPGAARKDVLKELVRSSTEFVVENRSANVTMQPNKERALDDARHEAALSFIGKAAHASTPARGHNAIVDALGFCGTIETFPLPVQGFCQLARFLGASVDGTNMQIDREHPFIGKTTVCLSLLQVTKTGGRALLNIRPTMGITTSEVTALARKAADAFAERFGLAVRLSHRGKPKEAIFLDPANPAVAPFIESMQEAFGAVTGTKGELRAIGGTTYAKAFPNFCAFGPTLDEPDFIHQVDERAPVEAVVRNAKIYGLTLACLAGRALPARRAAGG